MANILFNPKIQDKQILLCKECERELKESSSNEQRSPCPHCGSVNRINNIYLHTAMAMPKEMIRVKVKDKSLSSRDNPRIDYIIGDEQRRSDGKWMKKVRRIDKNKDEYSEQVLDPENGDVVHECKESLRKHTGHGSAKKK